MYTLKYPTQTSSLSQISATNLAQIAPERDVVYIYIGSTNNQSAQTLVSWQKTPTNNGGGGTGGGGGGGGGNNNNSLLLSMSAALMSLMITFVLLI